MDKLFISLPENTDRPSNHKSSFPYITVMEDILWFKRDWWDSGGEGLSDEYIRRGSTTLRLLLIEGMLGTAWRHYKFVKQPSIYAPDMMAWITHFGFEPKLAPLVLAGGGRLKGKDIAGMGIFRIDNPETGVPANADEGFALTQKLFMRDVSLAPQQFGEDSIFEHRWTLSEYLHSPAVILNGNIYSRQHIIKYFANFAGGAHLGRIKQSNIKDRRFNEEVSKYEGRMLVDDRDGLIFELLSIGQAIGRSPDLLNLAETINEQYEREMARFSEVKRYYAN